MTTKIKEILFSNIGLVLIYIAISIIYIDLPGLYMDAVNPDYMAAHMIHPENIGAWIYPDNVISYMIHGEWYKDTILSSLYGAVTPAYIGLIFFKVFGFNIFTIRFVHILYGIIIIIFFNKLMDSIAKSKKISFICTLIFILDPTFIFVWRTQYYLQLFPLITFLPGLKVIIDELYSCYKGKKINLRKIFLGNVLLGFSATGYFIYAFYFATIFCFFIYFCIKKRLKIRNLFYHVIFPFIIGYIPYIYAHISIFICQGFSGYMTNLKNINNSYGIVDGRDSVLNVLVNIFERFSNFSGGNWLITYMTGIDIGEIWGKAFLIIFFICAIFFTIDLLNNIKNDKSDRITYIRLLLSVIYAIFIIHIFIGCMIGNSLGYQHYIMLLPLMFISIFGNFMVFYERYREKVSNKKIVITSYLLIVIVIVSGCVKIVEGYRAINKTGGIGFYSDAINRAAYYTANMEENSVLICPQFGYWMGISLLTGGEKEIWFNTDTQEIINNLNSRGDIKKCYILIADNGYDLLNENFDNDLVENIINNTQYIYQENKVDFYEKGGNHIFKIVSLTK